MKINLEQQQLIGIRVEEVAKAPSVNHLTLPGRGLVPIMSAVGTGSDVMKRIAAPMVGGIFTLFLLELPVYPTIYEIWKSRSLPGSAAKATIVAEAVSTLSPQAIPVREPRSCC